MAWSTFLPACWCIPYQYDEPQNIVVRASSTETMTKVGQKSADILNGYMNAKRRRCKIQSNGCAGTCSTDPEFQCHDEHAADLDRKYFSSGQRHRRYEHHAGIGNRANERDRTEKAIGAKKRSILTQFLTEAVVLTSLGGIIGVIAGNILAQVIHKVSRTPVAISIPAILISVLFSMVIGIVFGLLPSVQAANLDPIDALRHE